MSAAWALAEVLERDLKRTRAGDRAGALQVYADFCKRLRAELSVDPSRETVSLATALRAQA